MRFNVKNPFVLAHLIAYAIVIGLLVLMTVDMRKAAGAEPVVLGIDPLALAKINGKMLAEEIESGMAIGYLDVTFGNPYPNLKTVLDTGKVVAVRVHLVDGTCIRNRVCPNGAPTYKSFDELKARAVRFHNFMESYPAVKQYVSPFLEHDDKDHTDVERWYNIIQANVPNAVPVCSAFTGWCPKGVKSEKHGNSAKADIISNDGASHFDSDSDQYRAGGSILALSWVPEDNCRVSGEKSFVYPKDRKDCATRAIVRQQIAVIKVGPKLPSVRGCSVVPSSEISKTNAEYYGAGKDDGRGNKLLYINNSRTRNITIHTLTGKKVAQLGFYGPYSGGGYRHYIGFKAGGGSGQRPVELAKLLGSEWGLFKDGKKCTIFNAIRRKGKTRDN